jgi:hypothetical protein
MSFEEWKGMWVCGVSGRLEMRRGRWSTVLSSEKFPEAWDG